MDYRTDLFPMDEEHTALLYGLQEHRFTREDIERLHGQIVKPLVHDRVEIIVLKYKQPLVETECVRRIIEHTDSPYTLTLYDNRANTANFAKVWNKLIDEARSEYVVIMDSDAMVTPGWLSGLKEAFKYPECGISAPVVNNTAAAQVQQRGRKDAEPELINGHISGFCFMTKKSIVKEIGWFDERFYVFGQESDFIQRMLAGKYRCYVCPRALVTHGMEGVGSSNATREAADKNEFNWGLDTSWSCSLMELHAQHLKNKKGDLP